jgi:hypothetical protein
MGTSGVIAGGMVERTQAEARTIRSALSAAEGAQEQAKFVVDVLVRRDRQRDLFAQKLAIALPQAMKGDSHRGFTHPEFGGEGGVGSVGAATRQARAEFFEKRQSIRGEMFGAQTRRNLGKQSQRPGAVECAIGRKIRGGRARDREFQRVGAKRWQKMCAAFLRLRAVAQIGEVVVEAAEEKRPETSAFAIDASERFESQQARKKSLNCVLGIGGREATLSSMGVERWPVGTTKIRERRRAIFR